jgi:hypothetical protein
MEQVLGNGPKGEEVGIHVDTTVHKENHPSHHVNATHPVAVPIICSEHVRRVLPHNLPTGTAVPSPDFEIRIVCLPPKLEGDVLRGFGWADSELVLRIQPNKMQDLWDL